MRIGEVVAQMGEIMAEVGGDGFLVRNPFHHMTGPAIATR
jgi:hypothetical protein